MLRSLGGKSVSSVLGLNITFKMHLIYVCVCVCVCIIMQNTAYCSRNYFPRDACLCSRGSSLMLAVFNPKQLTGLPFCLEPLLQCRVEVNGKDIDRPVILLNTCCWFLPADWPGRDLPVPSRNYTNAVLRKTECVHSQETLDKDWFCNAILYLGLFPLNLPGLMGLWGGVVTAVNT